MDNLRVTKFKDVNLNDPFFDSLKDGYQEFSDWFKRKAEDSALVLYSESGLIEGFLYCKFESGPGDDTTPPLPDSEHMKVGTFKFNPQGTRRGDRYLKKIFDYAFERGVDDVYVTVFGQQHEYLVELFTRYGFEQYAVKESANGTENVLLRTLKHSQGDVDKDYPLIKTNGNSKFLLGIQPQFHTKLFPDSRLHTESPNIVGDISHSNSIHKIYLCNMRQVQELQRGDVIVIYRMKDPSGPAEYTAVATSLCVVENVHNIDDYTDEEEFIRKCGKFSVFSESELRVMYKSKSYPYIINFTYNVALPKRPIRKVLVESVGLSRDDRWSCLRLTDDQFERILQTGEVNEKFLNRT
ncbi:N-acetyltransferase [Enterovibrio norvegicus]|uniref:N-acetyltransferase n=1 Tax=Enterovibrio norvegicus TaxID=188144 RepID=UPI000C865027|nr:N-acetyltransferase [Enterovibrio norvegicus]PMH59601.1 acetyltransferase [Enterovibrio norvegicus]